MNVQSLARKTLAAALFALGLGCAQGVAQETQQDGGNQVTLRSFDGFTQLRGTLLEFDGETFTIDTVLGVIQVDALQVECEGDACPQNLLFGAEFGVHGSNTIGAELMPALIQGYADSLDATLVTEVGASSEESTLRIVHANGREMAAINLVARGSTMAFQSLAAGTAEIGMSSRRSRDRDMPILSSAGFADPRDTDAEHVVGLDGLIAIVHPSNPIQSISLEELALVFSGTITNWAQLGGRDEAINLYARDEGSGTFQTFGSLVLAPFDVQIAASAQRFLSNIRLSDTVANDPAGIGVTAVAFERAARALPIRQACGIRSYPTTFAMKTEEYPLSRRLYLYTPRNNMTAHARQLIEFAKSDAAQPLIADAGFVNQAVEALPVNTQGSRIVYALTGEPEVSVPLLRDFLSEVASGVRLSTTFRFTPGGSQLEPKSRVDAVRFAEDIAAGVYDGKEILLVGFTDSVGQFDLNLALSRRRAEALNQVLRSIVPGALDDAAIRVLGFGELAPVGCNDTMLGRSMNRRVEVWLRDPR